jgi:hypothetical protein
MNIRGSQKQKNGFKQCCLAGVVHTANEIDSLNRIKRKRLKAAKILDGKCGEVATALVSFADTRLILLF